MHASEIQGCHRARTPCFARCSYHRTLAKIQYVALADRGAIFKTFTSSPRPPIQRALVARRHDLFSKLHLHDAPRFFHHHLFVVVALVNSDAERLVLRHADFLIGILKLGKRTVAIGCVCAVVVIKRLRKQRVNADAFHSYEIIRCFRLSGKEGFMGVRLCNFVTILGSCAKIAASNDSSGVGLNG